MPAFNFATVDRLAQQANGAPNKGALPEPSRGRFFYRSLRMRLVAIVVAIDCVTALLTGTVIILKACTATKLEIASSMQLAEVLVDDTIRLLQEAPTPVLLQSIQLHFKSVRHVQISLIDKAGKPVVAPASRGERAAQATAGAAKAPAWFSRLIAPPIEMKDFPIVVGHERIGDLTIRSEPSDEIDEAWNYAYTLLLTASCLNIIVLVSLFFLFGYVLLPLTVLVSGLKDLRGRNYAVRLPRPSLFELATITDHFNRTAQALSAAHDANRLLSRKLVTAQDDERRRMALELHDEAGPCLFALEANASSIVALTAGIDETSRINARAQEMVGLVAKIQWINRQVLDRLRPMALGRIPLRECIGRLVMDFENKTNGTDIDTFIGAIQDSYGPLIDLTIYRCVQEGLFNAIRHANCPRVVLIIEEDEAQGRPLLRLTTSDNGHGHNRQFREGVGLSGMRERIEALSGTFEILPSDEGTTLMIVLPIDASEGPADLPTSLSMP